MPAPRERQLDRFAQTDRSRTASWCSTIADSQRSRCPLNCIDGLGTCPELENVSFRCAKELMSLVPLAGAPQLRVVDASWTGVQSVDGLERCLQLECVDFTGCHELASLAPLSGAPQLRKIEANHSAVRHLDDVHISAKVHLNYVWVKLSRHRKKSAMRAHGDGEMTGGGSNP
ncbi:hypothetical protein NXY56_000095 [Leishmania guyanensis]